MAGKDEYRIFVGGLSWNVTEGQLEDGFARFGKIIEAQIMLERGTNRPRGFGFITFADRRGMDDAIREMHGQEFGDRTISVNKAQPKMSDDDGDRDRGGYRGSLPSGGRKSYGGDRPAAGQDDCFKCGRPGHWARDCPSAGGGAGRFPDRFGGGYADRERFGDRERFADRDRYIDDRYDAGRYTERDRYDMRDSRYGSRDRYVSDRYQPSERFGSERYSDVDRYPPIGYEKERGFDRGGGPRGGGGFGRSEGRNYRSSRPTPYDRPIRAPRPSSFERY